jgi:hypothetical protein
VRPFITQEMIGQLIELSDRNRAEAARCADAGAFEAGCVMMAATFEAMLFCTVSMSEHVLQPAGNWPEGDPFKWTLGVLVGIANRAGWFAGRGVGESDLGEAVEAVNDLRIFSLHPAAAVRDGAVPLGEREFAAIFNLLVAADDALAAVIDALPDPPRD